MRTKLIEFTNQENETLRGIFNITQRKPESGTIFCKDLRGILALKTPKYSPMN